MHVSHVTCLLGISFGTQTPVSSRQHIHSSLCHQLASPGSNVLPHSRRRRQPQAPHLQPQLPQRIVQVLLCCLPPGLHLCLDAARLRHGHGCPDRALESSCHMVVQHPLLHVVDQCTGPLCSHWRQRIPAQQTAAEASCLQQRSGRSHSRQGVHACCHLVPAGSCFAIQSQNNPTAPIRTWAAVQSTPYTQHIQQGKQQQALQHDRGPTCARCGAPVARVAPAALPSWLLSPS
jgi:hypothetical protein